MQVVRSNGDLLHSVDAVSVLLNCCYFKAPNSTIGTLVKMIGCEPITGSISTWYSGAVSMGTVSVGTASIGRYSPLSATGQMRRPGTGQTGCGQVQHTLASPFPVDRNSYCPVLSYIEELAISVWVVQCTENCKFVKYFTLVKKLCFTIMEKSYAPFSLGGDSLKRYFDQR